MEGINTVLSEVEPVSTL